MKITPTAAFSSSKRGTAIRFGSFVLGLTAVVTVGAATKDTTTRHVDDKTVEWQTLGGDLAHTRYAPLKQITPENFGQLKAVWTWDGASFKAQSGRSTPSYMNGKLFTVAGEHRSVIAIDPATGETIWSYREPGTPRYDYSMRKDYGKGVGYGEINGRGVVYIISPAFFLTALDADTGAPIEGFGAPVPIKGFPKTGVVDLLKDLGHPYDPYNGIDLKKGYITSSSPPLVVNGVIVVGNSAEQGYNQSRVENIPGDILAYDAGSGKFLWKFNVLPKEGEFGHDTWENDAWKWTGDISSWAPLSADAKNNIVYVPTNGATVDFYGGFRPGNNLFSTSLIALDLKTGKRKWHFQMVHHDIWNYDTPTAPVLLDVRQNGQNVPAVVQVTKQAFAYAFNRVTGDPLWPIIEKPVAASKIPGEKMATTQPFPTKPAPYDMQGLTNDDLINFTPELREKAIKAVSDYEIGPLFLPPLHRDNNLGKKGSLWCPGDVGGVNIDGPAAADPATGILYVTSRKGCTSRIMAPGEERDKLEPKPTGTTISKYAVLGGQGVRGPDDLPLFKPPYSRITAIDMNTGETLWWIPVGETPDRIKKNPKLAGVNVGDTGTGRVATMTVTDTMLIYQGETSDGTPHLFAVDKKTGKTLAKVKVPGITRYGMMSYMHNGHQYIMLQAGSKLIAMGLPDAMPKQDSHGGGD
jgi:quinoprotein glucose dehydrogenase